MKLQAENPPSPSHSPPNPPTPGSCWQIPILHFPTAGLLNPSSWKRLHPALAGRPARGYWGPPEPPDSHPCGSQERGVTRAPRKGGFLFPALFPVFHPKPGVRVGALLTPALPPRAFSPPLLQFVMSPCAWGQARAGCGQTDRQTEGRAGAASLSKSITEPSWSQNLPPHPATPFHTSPSQRLLRDQRPRKHPYICPSRRTGMGGDGPQALRSSVSLLTALCKAKPCSATTSA